MSTMGDTAGGAPEERHGDLAPALGHDDEADLGPGERVGGHVVEGVLGRGSFGTVYRARHEVLGRAVAIKVLHLGRSNDRRAVARFVAEARMVASLRHPHVVDVTSFGDLADGRHFLVMELVSGSTLEAWLHERAPVPLAEALPVLRGIASALDAVHAAGIAHRDLKPANVVLEVRDGAPFPKLIDFGIAKLLPSGGGADAGATVGFLGTPRYMAPEQCRGRPVDGQADVYSFGLLAFEMLTGTPPFAGSEPLDLMMCHTSATPAAPSSVIASLPAAIDAAVLRLLAKDPAERPRLLVPVVDELTTVTAAPRSRRWSRLRGHAPWLVAVCALAMAGAVLAVSVAPRRSPAANAASAASAAPPPAAPGDAVASQGPAPPRQEAMTVPIPEAAPGPPDARRLTTTAAPRVSTAPATPATPPGLDDPEDPYLGASP